jgi:hypothetical protein
MPTERKPASATAIIMLEPKHRPTAAIMATSTLLRTPSPTGKVNLIP